MRTTIFLLVILLLPMAFYGQPDGSKTAFSLKEAQDYAVQNSINIKNAAIDVEIAKKKVWETTAIGLPQVNGNVNYQNIFKVPEMSFGGYIDWTTMDPTIPLTSGYVMSHYVMPEPIQLGVKENVTWDITVSQLIFSGEYIVGLQAAKTFQQISDLSLVKSEIDTKLLITETYTLIQILEENKNILASSLANTEKLLTEMKATNQAGFLDQTSVDQFELTTHNLTNAKISVEKQIMTLKLLLKYQMGMNLEQEIILTESAESILATVQSDKILLQPFEISNNIDYQMLEVQEEITNLSLKRQKSTILPTLSAFYRHQEQMKTPEFNFTSPDMIGVSLKVPIFASGSRHVKIQQAQLDLLKIENTKFNVEQALNMQVEQNRNGFTTANNKYLLEKENLELSKRIYDNTLIKFNHGTASSMELTQAQNQMLTTQSGYFTAILELLKAKNNLDKALNNY
jgi:outer membrane protein TolC